MKKEHATQPSGASNTTHASNDTTANLVPTKKTRIRLALEQPGGLNRFEAERIGDHCLNSTIADLRHEGWLIIGKWETVPSRYSSRGVRVLRYYSLGRKSRGSRPLVDGD